MIVSSNAQLLGLLDSLLEKIMSLFMNKNKEKNYEKIGLGLRSRAFTTHLGTIFNQ